MIQETKRLFFALEVTSRWPEEFPGGRLLSEECRHMTLAFLGNVAPFDPVMFDIPMPSSFLSPVGRFDRCLFLPPRHPNVVAWHVHWFNGEPLLAFQRELTDWVQEYVCPVDDRPFVSHVTLARWPFDKEAWSHFPYNFPVLGTALHLYESLGNLHYEPRWTMPLIPVIEDVSHTADIAFKIRGETYPQLFLHAQAALAFAFPPFTPFMVEENVDSLEEIIAQLNTLVSKADAALGVPFKAVSYHGDIMKGLEFLEWEMIVDV